MAMTRRNRRNGNNNGNGPSVRYFERLMANRAAARNAVNVRGNPLHSRKSRKNRKNRKGTRKNRKNRRGTRKN
jgi:hypothetical protein